ncbi:MAG: HDIG domain-containing protein [Bacteroidaceae bacterium]|nr:HDIG domain-containing protein [Bacteroidaceae bacterium]
MDTESLIHKYYASQPKLEAILLRHSRQVAERCMAICERHPELGLNRQFLWEAAMLHDIGIIETDAPGILCRGEHPYVEHGRIGGRILREEGLPEHARVAERHTGAGLPGYLPETPEEQVVCYADKFYSKSRLDDEKTPERVVRSLERFGHDGVERFLRWHALFG